MTYSGATDTRRLLAGLQEYQKSLEKHIAQLTSEYNQLENLQNLM